MICVDADRCVKWASSKLGDFTYQGWWAAIGHESNGELLAAVIYTQDVNDIELHVVVEPASRWLTTEFVGAVFAYPFKQLGVQRVSAKATRSNVVLQRLLLSLGFEIEGIKRKALYGEDAILFGMLREECRYG